MHTLLERIRSHPDTSGTGAEGKDTKITENLEAKRMDLPGLVTNLDEFFTFCGRGRSVAEQELVETYRQILDEVLTIHRPALLNLAKHLPAKSPCGTFLRQSARSNPLPAADTAQDAAESESSRESVLHQELLGILVELRSAETTHSGLVRLHAYTTSHPDISLDTHFANMSAVFRRYVTRGLERMTIQSNLKASYTQASGLANLVKNPAPRQNGLVGGIGGDLPQFTEDDTLRSRLRSIQAKARGILADPTLKELKAFDPNVVQNVKNMSDRSPGVGGYHAKRHGHANGLGSHVRAAHTQIQTSGSGSGGFSERRPLPHQSTRIELKGLKDLANNPNNPSANNPSTPTSDAEFRIASPFRANSHSLSDTRNQHLSADSSVESAQNSNNHNNDPSGGALSSAAATGSTPPATLSGAEREVLNSAVQGGSLLRYSSSPSRSRARLEMGRSSFVYDKFGVRMSHTTLLPPQNQPGTKTGSSILSDRENNNENRSVSAASAGLISNPADKTAAFLSEANSTVATTGTTGIEDNDNSSGLLNNSNNLNSTIQSTHSRADFANRLKSLQGKPIQTGPSSLSGSGSAQGQGEGGGGLESQTGPSMARRSSVDDLRARLARLQ